MANKHTLGRVIQKHGTTSDWAMARNFIPLAGEIIIYTDVNRLKIGDGINIADDLPFATDGGSGFYVGPTEPSEAEINTIWIDTTYSPYQVKIKISTTNWRVLNTILTVDETTDTLVVGPAIS